jgi:hypothetical protein
MKIKIYQVIALFLALLYLCAWSHSNNFQVFSFPPGSKPHQDNWTYLCKVIDWAPFGKASVEKGKRKIDIIIHDKSKINVLQDTLEIESASIETKIKWYKFEHITLSLYERGNEYAKDEYNKRLIKEGRKHLVTLSYVWNGEKYTKKSTQHALRP